MPEMEATQTITGIVLNSGDPGTFDTDSSDFDLLREAVIAAGLADTLDSEEVALTVFAPNDGAFIKLAQDLGYDGSDEAGALGHIIEALTLLGGGDPIPLLTEVLTYHVVDGVFDLAAVSGLPDGFAIPTLQGGTVELDLDPPGLGDADDGLEDPDIIETDIHATNGIIHVLDGVLLPISVTGIIGKKNTDFVLGTDADEFKFTGRGNDFVDGNGGNDVVFAGRGSDVVLGGADSDIIFGGRGKDILRGDEGDDIVHGGRGKDLIDGGTGNDLMSGGRGKDTFVLELGDGEDTILDFDTGRDKIDLSGYDGITGFADIEDGIDDGFFGTVIELEDGDSVTLLGVHASDLTESDFIFA